MSSQHEITYFRSPAAILGAALTLLAGGAHAQNFVDLQSSTPGSQQTGHSNISGTGLFGSIGVGTSSPVAGLHVNREAIPPGGTLALEGTTHSYMSFFPQGVANGRKAFFGIPSANSKTLSITNEVALGNIVLTPGSSAGVGINIEPFSETFRVYSPDDQYAVFAESVRTSGTTYGVFGRVKSDWYSFGMYGLALSTAYGGTGVAGRSDNSTGRGLYGSTTSSSGLNYGVYAYCGSSQGYALYGQGRFAATGTKSFVIDHPFDPEGMTLSHYCTEGAEPLNTYSGNVVLDEGGQAWVSLPDYFGEINTDPRYTLTALGAPMPQLHVASEVRQNRFRIAGGAAGGKVSWRIDAVRNDRWVRTHGAPVEQVKPAEIRGKYLDPSLFGQPAERGIDYQPEPDAKR